MGFCTWAGRSAGRVVAVVATAGTIFCPCAVAGASAGSASENTSVARSMADFGGDFYRAVGSGNAVVSPLSLEYAMAGLYAGSRGLTHSEITHLMHASLPQPQFLAGLAGIDGVVTAAGRGPGAHPQISSVNALWADLELTAKSDFAHDVRSYGSDLRGTDFHHAASAATAKINEWATAHTMGRIKEVFDDGAITSDTRMVIANAVYFKGQWKSAFLKDATEDDTFHRSTTSDVEVPMMHTLRIMDYASANGWQAVRLPYRGGKTSMLIVVPRAGMEAIDGHLSGAFLAGVRRRLHRRRVELTLPRFELRGDYDLVAALDTLGARRTVGADPNFSGMFSGVRPGDLRLGTGVHKTFIKVDEEGAEAAVVTASTVTLYSAPPRLPRIAVTADHPFLAVIQEDSTGVPLFYARVDDPSAG